eukprot:6324542-Amphidinium_carterae.1
MAKAAEHDVACTKVTTTSHLPPQQTIFVRRDGQFRENAAVAISWATACKALISYQASPVTRPMPCNTGIVRVCARLTWAGIFTKLHDGHLEMQRSTICCQ